MPKQKKPRGRPRIYEMPEPIPDSIENIVRSMRRDPARPADDWEYLREHKRKQEEAQKARETEE